MLQLFRLLRIGGDTDYNGLLSDTIMQVRSLTKKHPLVQG